MWTQFRRSYKKIQTENCIIWEKRQKESDLDFNSSDNKKTEFALDLLMKDDYNIPQYIRNGLEWLSSKNPYVDGEETDEQYK